MHAAATLSQRNWRVNARSGGKNGGNGGKTTGDRNSSQFIWQLKLQLLFQPACVRLSFFFITFLFLFFPLLLRLLPLLCLSFFLPLIFIFCVSPKASLGFCPSSGIVDDHFASSILDFTPSCGLSRFLFHPGLLSLRRVHGKRGFFLSLSLSRQISHR